MAEPTPAKIQQTYLTVSFLSVFASSLIRGIDALFLLDAGLSTSQVFTVYSFMTLGTTLFEIPTGSVADIKGRRLSFLIGTFALAAATFVYWYLWAVGAGFWPFAIVTFGFGVAYTFTSGSTDAWLVDALNATGYEGSLDSVFAKYQVVSGVAMLTGSFGGGLLAQATSLGVPYLVRGGLLLVAFAVAAARIHDLGFEPQADVGLLAGIRHTAAEAINYGWRVVSVRMMMISGLFLMASTGFIFYGMQPYLLDLYGNSQAYIVSGLAAMVISGAQIAGGFLAGPIRARFSSRTRIIATSIVVGAIAIMGIAALDQLVAAIVLLSLWSVALAVITPVRQAFLNAQIPSRQRASVLSVDSLVSSAGSIPAQPILGSVASSRGYPTAFMLAGAGQLVAVPFALWARRQCNPGSDKAGVEESSSASAG